MKCRQEKKKKVIGLSWAKPQDEQESKCDFSVVSRPAHFRLNYPSVPPCLLGAVLSSHPIPSLAIPGPGPVSQALGKQPCDMGRPLEPPMCSLNTLSHTHMLGLLEKEEVLGIKITLSLSVGHFFYFRLGNIYLVVVVYLFFTMG